MSGNPAQQGQQLPGPGCREAAAGMAREDRDVRTAPGSGAPWKGGEVARHIPLYPLGMAAGPRRFSREAAPPPPAFHSIRTACPRPRFSERSLFVRVSRGAPQPFPRDAALGFSQPALWGSPRAHPAPLTPAVQQQPQHLPPRRVSRAGPEGAAYPSAISSRSSGAAGRGSGRRAMAPRLLQRLRG